MPDSPHHHPFAATTRLAPSPTGALHLGNARSFLITWAMARKNNWRNILRIEDMDTPRVKAGATEGILETLSWLGIDWDPPGVGPLTNSSHALVQSTDLSAYRAAMAALAARGLVYRCTLTRKQIEAAASAPQEGSHDVAFPASLRPAHAGEPVDFERVQREALGESGPEGQGDAANWRFLCPAGAVVVRDRIAGDRAFDPSAIVGDFVLWTKRDQPSYQLAVVVDDRRQGVDRVIRGDDLLDSAARQIRLYEALNACVPATERVDVPEYWHLPLVVGADGLRLAKRHGETRIDEFRRRGVPAEAIIGLIAYWSIPECADAPRRLMTAREFKDRLDPSTMPRTPIVCTPEDDQWLLSCARDAHR